MALIGVRNGEDDATTQPTVEQWEKGKKVEKRTALPGETRCIRTAVVAKGCGGVGRLCSGVYQEGKGRRVLFRKWLRKRSGEDATCQQREEKRRPKKVQRKTNGRFHLGRGKRGGSPGNGNANVGDQKIALLEPGGAITTKKGRRGARIRGGGLKALTAQQTGRQEQK